MVPFEELDVLLKGQSSENRGFGFFFHILVWEMYERRSKSN